MNLVSPGAVEGARLRWVISQQARETGTTEEDVLEQRRGGSPLRRLVRPEEVAAVVSFLAGPDSSAVTGQDLNVANGSVMG